MTSLIFDIPGRPGGGKVSREEYLRFEELSPRKNEYLDGVISEMAGGSAEHGTAITQLAIIFGGILRGSTCKFLGSESKVDVKAYGAIYYPDGMIACPPRYVDRKRGVIDNPIVVFEVLSPSTERFDRNEKFRSYESLESVKEIVLLSSTEPFVELFARRGEFFVRSVHRPGDRLPILGGENVASVDDLYEGVFEWSEDTEE